MKKLFAVISILGIFFIAGCEKKEAEVKKLTKVRFLLDWTPNTNHTGVYIAKEKGYYEKLGLDVEILPAGNDDAIEVLAAGGAEFSVGFQEWLTLAHSANAGLDVIAVAAILQGNTSGFLTKENSNIVTAKDLAGRNFGGSNTPLNRAIINDIIVKNGGKKDTVKYKNANSMDVMQGLQAESEFEWAYEGWDVIKSKLENKNMNFIKLTDYDKNLEFYTPVIMASNKYLKMNPELVKNFMAATAHGYEDAISDPKGATEILMKNAKGLDSALVEKSHEFLSKYYKGDALYWGYMKPEVWKNFTQFLYENGGIPNNVDSSKMFSNEYLESKK
ncbi:MAG: ABC transporter substrate-binding protein [Fusobacteriaceae bacterium]|nr:ABC transporter substrate-binding protein [Fusobacteriaceae bacterium]